jgi:hypothetical protein
VGPAQLLIVIAVDKFNNSRILGQPSPREFQPVLKQDLIKAFRLTSHTRESGQPQSVRKKQVVQRSMEATEKHAYVGSILFFWQIKCGFIKARVRPCVVCRELLEDVSHYDHPLHLI